MNATAFDANSLLSLAALAEVEDPRAGTTILEEGAAPAAVWLVMSGSVDVSKRDAAGFERTLATLGEGAVFGEMSFLDGRPASASVRAGTDARVLRLPREELDRRPELAEAKGRLVAALARAVVGRLRDLDGTYAETVRAKSEESKLRGDLGKLFVATVVIFGLGQLTQRLIVAGLSPAAHMAYSWGLLLVIVAVLGVFVRLQHAPLSTFGLTTSDWAKSAREGLLVGGAIVAVAIFARAIFGPAGPILTWGSVGEYDLAARTLFFALYLPHCFLQELVARGIIQGSLDRALGRGFAAVVITSVLFGVFHLHVSIAFAAITCAASLGLGAFYRRHRTLAGVTALHLVLGLGALALGLN